MFVINYIKIFFFFFNSWNILNLLQLKDLYHLFFLHYKKKILSKFLSKFLNFFPIILNELIEIIEYFSKIFIFQNGISKVY